MLVELLEIIANDALRHDANARTEISQLAGQSIAFTLKGNAPTVHVHLLKHGFEVTTDSEQAANVQLSASLFTVLKVLRYGLDNVELQPGELQISGDPILAQKFARIIANLNIDWQNLLADHLGDTPAAMIDQGMRITSDIFQQGRSRLKTQLHALMIEDLPLFANKDEVNTFLSGVDDLRAATGQLEKRLQRLQKLATANQ